MLNYYQLKQSAKSPITLDYGRVSRDVGFVHLRKALQFVEQFPEEELSDSQLWLLKQDIQSNFIDALMRFRRGLKRNPRFEYRKELLDKIIHAINVAFPDNPIPEFSDKPIPGMSEEYWKMLDKITNINTSQTDYYAAISLYGLCLNAKEKWKADHTACMRQRTLMLDTALEVLRLEALSLGDFEADRKGRLNRFEPYREQVISDRLYVAATDALSRIPIASEEEARNIYSSFSPAEPVEPELAEGEEDAIELMDLDDPGYAPDDETDTDEEFQLKRPRC